MITETTLENKPSPLPYLARPRRKNAVRRVLWREHESLELRKKKLKSRKRKTARHDRISRSIVRRSRASDCNTTSL